MISLRRTVNIPRTQSHEHSGKIDHTLPFALRTDVIPMQPDLLVHLQTETRIFACTLFARLAIVLLVVIVDGLLENRALRAQNVPCPLRDGEVLARRDRLYELALVVRVQRTTQRTRQEG
jgi:hypothetical protein